MDDMRNRYDVNDQTFEKLHEALMVSFENLKKEFQKVSDAFTRLKEESNTLEPTEPVYDISWIRKRMKCCKNPMERKQLEKQLNAAYKARKKAMKKNVP